MPIISTDIQYRLSGGASNSDGSAALGGVISSNAVATSVNSLWDAKSSAEALAGRVEYRCFYVRNGHATLTALGAKVWIEANTPGADTAIEIGLGTSAISATEQTVANETTAPTGVSFGAAASEGAALTIGDLAPGATKAVWVKLTVNAAAAGPITETFNFRTKCDTNP